VFVVGIANRKTELFQQRFTTISMKQETHTEIAIAQTLKRVPDFGCINNVS